MRDFTKIPPRDADSEVREQYLLDLSTAIEDGAEVAQAVAKGGSPNVEALDDYAQALEGLRVGVANKRLCFEWMEPTEDDVRDARTLVRLVREGAPAEALIEPARRAVRVCTDASAVARYNTALTCLADGGLGAKHLDRILAVLDFTAAHFERGCRVAGFTAGALDVANVRRLRELASTAGAEALQERRRLTEEIMARLPFFDPEMARYTDYKDLYWDDE